MHAAQSRWFRVTGFIARAGFILQFEAWPLEALVIGMPATNSGDWPLRPAGYQTLVECCQWLQAGVCASNCSTALNHLVVLLLDHGRAGALTQWPLYSNTALEDRLHASKVVAASRSLHGECTGMRLTSVAISGALLDAIAIGDAGYVTLCAEQCYSQPKQCCCAAQQARAGCAMRGATD